MKRPQPSFVFYFVQEGDGYVAQHCNPRSIFFLVSQKFAIFINCKPLPLLGRVPPF